MRIYLDNCCYTRTFDDQKQIKVRNETESIIKIQEKIISKDIELATSFILHYENNQKIDDDHKNKIDNFLELTGQFTLELNLLINSEILLRKLCRQE